MIEMTTVTIQRFKLGNASQMTVMTHPVNDTALPTPRVNSIKKKSTAKSFNSKHYLIHG